LIALPFSFSAEAGPGRVGHEAEGFGGRGADHFVDVDAHPVGDDLHLVHQADVHRAVDVLQQLRHLLGMFQVENFSLPGSFRPGEKTTNKSSPVAHRPVAPARAPRPRSRRGSRRRSQPPKEARSEASKQARSMGSVWQGAEG
jgi:hypothetical protein